MTTDSAPPAPAPAPALALDLLGLFGLQGRVAFIPGGYGGIGEAIAWALAAGGARVAVAGRHIDKAEALAVRLRAAGQAGLASKQACVVGA